jgi:phage host-nuclease inhibitor protein Gam
MDDEREVSSWLESRRLIISKLSSMETDLRDYGQKVERVIEAMRERHSETSEKVAAQMAEMRVTIAMVEVKLKIWCALIGCVASAGISLLVDFMIKRM